MVPCMILYVFLFFLDPAPLWTCYLSFHPCLVFSVCLMDTTVLHGLISECIWVPPFPRVVCTTPTPPKRNKRRPDAPSLLGQVGAAAVLHVPVLKAQETSASSHNTPLQLFTTLQVVCKDLLTCREYWAAEVRCRGNEVRVWKCVQACGCVWVIMFNLAQIKQNFWLCKCILFSARQNISFFVTLPSALNYFPSRSKPSWHPDLIHQEQSSVFALKNPSVPGQIGINDWYFAQKALIYDSFSPLSHSDSCGKEHNKRKDIFWGLHSFQSQQTSRPGDTSLPITTLPPNMVLPGLCLYYNRILQTP